MISVKTDHLVDGDLVYCLRVARDVGIERCLSCGALAELREVTLRDGSRVLAVRCATPSPEELTPIR